MSETFEYLAVHLFSDKFTNERRTVEMTYDDSGDLEEYTTALENMIRCGWEIGAVHAFTDYDKDGTVIHMSSVDDVMTFLGVLLENEYDTTRILSYGEINGWDIDNFTSSRYVAKYEDSFFMIGDSRADLAREYHEEFEEFKESTYIVVDWDRTAYQMSMDGFTFHERAGFSVILND